MFKKIFVLFVAMFILMGCSKEEQEYIKDTIETLEEEKVWKKNTLKL